MQTAAAIIGLIIFGLAGAYAQKQSSPDVPAAIQAPSGLEVVLLAHASGSQL
jgi:hypothetical protein